MNAEAWVYIKPGEPEYFYEGIDIGVKKINQIGPILVITHHNGDKRTFANIPFELLEETK